jgi:hypothetical protein
MTVIHCPGLVRMKPKSKGGGKPAWSKSDDEYLRHFHFVDPEILALDMKVSVCQIWGGLNDLGLRHRRK